MVSRCLPHSDPQKGRVLHLVRYETGDQHREELKECRWRLHTRSSCKRPVEAVASKVDSTAAKRTAVHAEL